ncbi:MAG TPA: hypothetical protein VHG72_21275 [Polyangia bacterium]|nr:hypothetical protein [Polyangia bacterium]
MTHPRIFRRLSIRLCLGLVVAGGACAGCEAGRTSGAGGEQDNGAPSPNTGGSRATGGSDANPAGGASGSGGAVPGSAGSGGSPGAGGELSGTGGHGATGGSSGGAGSGTAPGTGGRAGATGAAGDGGGSGGRAGATGAAGASALTGVCYPNEPHAKNLNNDNWAGALTLFISYSADTRSQTVDKGYTPAAWNAAVNSFDVSSFATQVANTGAKNILLMLGQNTGYYNSPNPTYEMYAGVAANTRCSTRDLPMEIADALAAKGIGLYLYLPEDVGWGDTRAANAFGLTTQAVDNWVVDATFTPKWNAVIKTWADRYGSKVRGWFFDGYEARWGVTATMANTYSATCKAANPCAIVTFNGTGSDSVSDTQRGETAIDTSTGLPAKGLPTSRWDKNDLQVMWDFPLQAAWGQEIADNSPAIYTNANLEKFVAAAVKAQAVFALDVRTSLAGALSTPIYNQLLAIKQ